MSANYLRFWGVRGSYPAPFESHLKTGGNTSCVEIRLGNEVIILDAGTGIIPLGNELMEQDNVKDINIFLTHFHWDHISGLPFFVPAFTPGHKVKFFGPGSSKADLEEHISQQMRAPYFPIETETWLADVEYLESGQGPLTLGAAEIEHFNVHHPGSTYGYKIRALGKTIAYASDNELTFMERAIDKRKDEFEGEEMELFEEMKREEKLRSIEFMRDVDILIHDSQYTPQDYERKRGWGHSCYIDTVNAAVDSKVKNLYLFHVDPSYTDRMVEEIHAKSLTTIEQRSSSTACHVAREGLIIDLDDRLSEN